MKSALITTTINVPRLLTAYAQDIVANSNDCFIVVVGDKKTPLEAAAFCSDLAATYKLSVTYLDVQAQEKYLERFPELGAHIPYNCIMRRNIGLLYAYEHGAEKIVTIDDDNFITSNNFMDAHAVGEATLDSISSDTCWYNVCEPLTEEADQTFFHRGFPLPERFKKMNLTHKQVTGRVVVNAGFWLGDPDIDALTRLYYLGRPINVTASTTQQNFALAHGTWSPFNSQNTALHRTIMPAYFLSPLVGRYDDIWASYIIKRIADHLGDYVAFGNPVVKQERNPHNYWKDLAQEDVGMQLTPLFVELLNKTPLTGTSYGDCYTQLYSAMKDALVSHQNEKERSFYEGYMRGMEVWIKTFQRLAQYDREHQARDPKMQTKEMPTTTSA